jgi:hypothetical protein
MLRKRRRRPAGPAQKKLPLRLRSLCAWSKLPLLAFLSALQGRDEETTHPSLLSPHLSTRPPPIARRLSAALCPSAPPAPCRDLTNRRNFLSHPPPPPHLGSSPTPRAQPAPLTPPRNPQIPSQSSPTGARRFRRIRAPAGEAVRPNRPIGREFGRSGCARSGGPRI